MPPVDLVVLFVPFVLLNLLMISNGTLVVKDNKVDSVVPCKGVCCCYTDLGTGVPFQDGMNDACASVNRAQEHIVED